MRRIAALVAVGAAGAVVWRVRQLVLLTTGQDELITTLRRRVLRIEEAVWIGNPRDRDRPPREVSSYGR